MKIRGRMSALAAITVLASCGMVGCSSQVASMASTAPATTPMHGVAQATHSHGGPAHHSDTANARHNQPTAHAHAKHVQPHGSEHSDKAKLPARAVKVGDTVPDFSVRTLDGKNVKLSELQKDAGKTKDGVVVLSFWCATCHSCRDVEPLLAQLAKDFAGQAYVMALDANAGETIEEVNAFLKKKGMTLPVVLDPDSATADLFGVKKTTTTLVIDGKGILRYCGQFRQRKGGSAEAALKSVLAGTEVAVKTTPHNG